MHTQPSSLVAVDALRASPSRGFSRRYFALAALAGLGAVVGAVSPSRAAVVPPQTERGKVAHLLRRAGFGPSRAELDEHAALGFEGTLSRLLNYQQMSDGLDARIARLAPDVDLTRLADLQRWWFLRMALTWRPLEEKMTLFWHGLLTSGVDKVGGRRLPLLHQQNQFFRANAVGDFRTIMQGISKDPAMMIYLDINGSNRRQPNENYARELMELFTTGIGPYSEDDIRQAARAFTGWRIDFNNGNKVLFNRGAFDSGQKTFLGLTGNFSGDDIVNILVDHPSTGWRLAGELFSFFAYDTDDRETLQPLADAYYQQSRSVKAMLDALFRSPAFFSEQAYRAQVKTPVELMVGIIRSLDLPAAGQGLGPTGGRLGQSLFDPPNVAGWPGGVAWLNSGTWLERLNFINRVTTNRRDVNTTAPFDPGAFLNSNGLRTPEQAMDYFVDLLVDGNVSDESRAVLLNYLTDGGRVPAGQPAWTDARWVDERVRGLVYLIMAMPEYHLN